MTKEKDRPGFEPETFCTEGFTSGSRGSTRNKFNFVHISKKLSRWGSNPKPYAPMSRSLHLDQV